MSLRKREREGEEEGEREGERTRNPRAIWLFMNMKHSIYLDRKSPWMSKGVMPYLDIF